MRGQNREEAAAVSGSGGSHTTRVSVTEFRERLEPQGQFVQVQGLGEAWKPRDVPADWTPYSKGRWIFNQQVGWFWEFDEPWGEIVFHYGRWYQDADQGWVWVADTQWAPAWVEWRRSKKFVGWRPLPPENAPKRVAKRSKTTTTTTRRGGTAEEVSEEWVFVPTERIVSEEISVERVPRKRVVEVYEETRPIGRVRAARRDHGELRDPAASDRARDPRSDPVT